MATAALIIVWYHCCELSLCNKGNTLRNCLQNWEMQTFSNSFPLCEVKMAWRAVSPFLLNNFFGLIDTSTALCEVNYLKGTKIFKESYSNWYEILLLQASDPDFALFIFQSTLTCIKRSFMTCSEIHVGMVQKYMLVCHLLNDLDVSPVPQIHTCQLFLFWRNSSSFRSKTENDFIMCSCFCSNLCRVMYRKFRNVPLFKFFFSHLFLFLKFESWQVCKYVLFIIPTLHPTLRMDETL